MHRCNSASKRRCASENSRGRSGQPLGCIAGLFGHDHRGQLMRLEPGDMFRAMRFHMQAPNAGGRSQKDGVILFAIDIDEVQEKLAVEAADLSFCEMESARRNGVEEENWNPHAAREAFD